MRKTEDHGLELGLGETGDEVVELGPDSPHELMDTIVIHAGNTELLLNDSSELGVGNSQLLLQILVHNFLLKELLQI